jgi:hypothetical protein
VKTIEKDGAENEKHAKSLRAQTGFEHHVVTLVVCKPCAFTPLWSQRLRLRSWLPLVVIAVAVIT